MLQNWPSGSPAVGGAPLSGVLSALLPSTPGLSGPFSLTFFPTLL